MSVQLSEKGIIAFTALLVCGTLLGMGKDSTVGYTLLAIVIGYFGIEVCPFPQITHRTKGDG